MPNVNVDKVKKAVEAAGPKSLLHKVMAHMASRVRPRRTTDLKRLRYEMIRVSGESVDNAEFLAVFELLNKLHVGELQYARRADEPARFTWHVEGIELARQVLGLKPLAPPDQAVALSLKMARVETVQQGHKPSLMSAAAQALAAQAVPPNSVAVRLSSGGTVYLPMSLTATDVKAINKAMTHIVELAQLVTR